MDLNQIKKNSDAELEGNYDHILTMSMVGIGGGFEGKEERKKP